MNFAYIEFSSIRLFIANQEKDALMDNTILHLEDRGYDRDSVIEEMSIVNIGGDDRIYAVVVTFNDESDVDYFYTYEKGTNQIIQIDVGNRGSNESLKHQES
ncbi:hypothetical protein ACM26V_03730 [Salipaludibacillus sp. HK11]|uniref:hypothetical protein n=1 Tax=Salipaludibacillus sp. HK11 TaxID=3394320 RepID=UPI0039FD4B38